MTDQTVPTTTDKDEPYAAIAAELHRIAYVLAKQPQDKPPYVQLSILPDGTVEAVDRLALAVFGKRAETEPNSAGGWRHNARGCPVEGLYVSIHSTVPGPPDPREAELERLRAEIAELKSKQGYGRDTDNGEDPIAPPPGVFGESEGAPAGRAVFLGSHVKRYFSFGHGQTDPATGERLINKYVTVLAPTAEGCREAMLASRFGREWSMEYIPGRPKTDEWIQRWTEHERIVVGATAADEPELCGWMTPSGPCHLVMDHPLFPLGSREDSGHIAKRPKAPDCGCE